MATCKDCIHFITCKFDKELLDYTPCVYFADRSRFVELPCKVGDTAWIVVRPKNGDDHFYTGIVTGVHVTDRKTIYKLPCKRFNYIVIRFVQTDSLKHINFNEIGKTVFFTKEEAEQALKEREKNEH
jgi:hypothetical protein